MIFEKGNEQIGKPFQKQSILSRSF